MLERAIGAARLNVATYEEVEADTTATGQAAAVVVIVAVLSGLGTAIAVGDLIPNLLSAIIGGLIGWVAWAAVTLWIGRALFQGTADLGEMLRVVGFAQSPRALGILSFIPILGFLIALVVLVWAIAAAVIAVRQGLDITTGQAVITVILGFIAFLIISIIVGVILAAIGLGASLIAT